MQQSAPKTQKQTTIQNFSRAYTVNNKAWCNTDFAAIQHGCKNKYYDINYNKIFACKYQNVPQNIHQSVGSYPYLDKLCLAISEWRCLFQQCQVVMSEWRNVSRHIIINTSKKLEHVRQLCLHCLLRYSRIHFIVALCQPENIKRCRDMKNDLH